MSKIKKLSVYEKHLENPFVKQAVERVNGHVAKKYRNSTNTGEKAILQAVDDNGEVLGHTSFVRQIEVDEDKFTKVYLSQFSAFWDLSPSAIRVFGYIMTKLIPKQDMFSFFLQECIQYSGYKTKKPIYDGLASLVNAEIIARGPSDSHYFINPLVAFNGDRVTYAKTYVKKKRNESNPNQIDIFGNVKLDE